MRLNHVITTAALAWAACTIPAMATPPKQPLQHTELKLAYGPNEIKAGSLVLRIVRAQVGTLSASDFDTYTVYLMPEKTGEPWLHVTTPASKGIGYNLRNYETGDANTQAVSFYRNDNRIYAVQATKVGPEADANGSVKTLFDFNVYIFNNNEEVPMFNTESATRSKNRYVDAREALQREFFKP